MMSALKQKLISTKAKGFLYFDLIGFDIGDVTFLMAWSAKEITKLTVSNADIGSIDISIDLPGHFPVWYLDLSEFICGIH